MTAGKVHVFRRSEDVPIYRPSVYSRSAILDPYPRYRELRALGPVVWLARHRLYALPRYAECKAALRDDGTYLSGDGVAANPVVNRLSRGTTLNSDGPEHERRRRLVAHRLMPRALRGLGEAVDEQAHRIVDAAVRRGTVDAVTDVATVLPLAVVPDLVGWPHDQRDHLLGWGAATFDMLGTANWQALTAVPRSVQMLRFARRVVRERNVLPGSMAHELLAAADDGDIGRDEVPALLIDYIAPSLDTTISAISSAIHLFATHPEQWELLKADSSLLPNAINEVVRFESPLRAFTRKAGATSVIAGVSVPAGARVLALYASANRDEHEWKDPWLFDIRRDAGRHVGFGNGAHACAGQGLARLETAAVLRALLDRVERIETLGEPIWAVNNIIRRLEHAPVRLVAG
ncbi:cytochrome P450 [Mycolicibacterium psychrotolerans]|uniref:Cytochrome P450 n=1 Tax=Mycolicibacterium psychrotolerans TaxID=216929 RepID=A0A7I7MB13_9MYCO|nr:cytochrome P450 [Mycolicibacterium psychrotolerans]BBX69461.1 cytochrome P450 [Mycolicibacterium psychrotolerans]